MNKPDSIVRAYSRTLRNLWLILLMPDETNKGNQRRFPKWDSHLCALQQELGNELDQHHGDLFCDLDLKAEIRNLVGSLYGNKVFGELALRDIFLPEKVLDTIANQFNYSINDIRSLFFSSLREMSGLHSFSRASLAIKRFCEICNDLAALGIDLQMKEKSNLPKSNFDGLEFLSRIESEINKDIESTPNDSLDPIALIVAANALGYVQPDYFRDDEVFFPTNYFDTEYFRSCFFGIWSNIAGLNDLFGGGGPYLLSQDSKQRGRVILIEGDYGNGKSTLALAIAADVARKGGFSWVIPFEQPPAENQQIVNDLNLIPKNLSRSIFVGVSDLAKLEKASLEDQSGAYLIMPTAKGSVEAVLDDALELPKRFSKYKLFAVVVDPLNSILDSTNFDSPFKRANFFEQLDRLREVGINIILSGENVENNSIVNIAEKIADVVIRLSSEETLAGYNQRFLEIRKSRLQREQRGKHPFSIKSGSGISVYPSSAAVAARLRHRDQRSQRESMRFGWKKMDRILGEDAILPGDSIAVTGPTGSFKTEVALLFALSVWKRSDEEKGRVRKSIFVPLKDGEEAIERLLGSSLCKTYVNDRQESQELTRSPEDDISILTLPGGFVQPGLILQRIEERILEMNKKGGVVDRIVFDNVEQWSMNCPFVDADAAFASTLVQFLKKYGITALFVIHSNVGGSKLGRIDMTLLTAADTNIEFDIIDYRGSQRSVFRVRKTRSMQHMSEYFDIYYEGRRLRIGNQSRLLNVKDGKASGNKPVRLYLHREGPIQEGYNQLIEDSLRPVLSGDIKQSSSDRTLVLRSLGLSDFSSVDELQILAIDEYQLPGFLQRGQRPSRLHGFSKEEWDSLGGDRFLGGSDKPSKNPVYKNYRYHGVPYIENTGVFVYDKVLLDGDFGNGWTDLADRCYAWESEHANDERSIFFDFSCDKSETYICFFLEIALGLGLRIPRRPTKFSRLLLENREVVAEAIRLFCLFGNRAHRLHPDSKSFVPKTKSAGDGLTPLVWRHWFTTAAEMFSEMSVNSRDHYGVCNIPAGSSVCGKWYLAVPFYSASPDVAYEILRILVEENEQAERLQLGVGLPVSQDFYWHQGSLEDILSCRYFDLDASETVEALTNSFCRSSISDYSACSSRLVFHLKKLLESEGIWKTNRFGEILTAVDLIAASLD